MTEKQNRLLNPWAVSGCEIEDKYVMNEVLNPELNNQDSYFTKENIEYNINRAKGGVGMITVGVHSVNTGVDKINGGAPYVGVTDSYHYISEAGEMIERIHEYGARVFVPLTAVDNSRAEKVNDLFQSPSAINSITQGFVRSALMAKLIGYDGVQINAVQEGFLLNQFSKAFCSLSGGDAEINLETRLKFANDIVKGIKRVCGSDFPVTLRFRINSFVDTLIQNPEWDSTADLKLEEIPEAIDTIKVLAIAGYDALDIDAGAGNSWCLTNDPFLAENEGFYPEESQAENASENPVFGYGMIEDIEVAAKALDKGIYEAINMEQFIFVSQNYTNKTSPDIFGGMNPNMY